MNLNLEPPDIWNFFFLKRVIEMRRRLKSVIMRPVNGTGGEKLKESEGSLALAVLTRAE